MSRQSNSAAKISSLGARLVRNSLPVPNDKNKNLNLDLKIRAMLAYRFALYFPEFITYFLAFAVPYFPPRQDSSGQII
jgi:hypothetical protein